MNATAYAPAMFTGPRPIALSKDPYESGVLLRLNVPIEDLRGYGATVVDRLRRALAAGVPAVKDRKRPRCYELSLEGESFYVFLLRDARPEVRKVLLVARWENTPA
jgi:hypothetical protein